MKDGCGTTTSTYYCNIKDLNDLRNIFQIKSTEVNDFISHLATQNLYMLRDSDSDFLNHCFGAQSIVFYISF